MQNTLHILDNQTMDELVERVSQRVVQILNEQQPRAISRELLTFAQMAAKLDISGTTLRKYVKAGQLIQRRLGKRIYFDWQENLNHMPQEIGGRLIQRR